MNLIERIKTSYKEWRTNPSAFTSIRFQQNTDPASIAKLAEAADLMYESLHLAKATADHSTKTGIQNVLDRVDSLLR